MLGANGIQWVTGIMLRVTGSNWEQLGVIGCMLEVIGSNWASTVMNWDDAGGEWDHTVSECDCTEAAWEWL